MLMQPIPDLDRIFLCLFLSSCPCDLFCKFNCCRIGFKYDKSVININIIYFSVWIKLCTHACLSILSFAQIICVHISEKVEVFSYVK